MQEYRIGNRTFRTPESYAAGKRDEKKILLIENKCENASLEEQKRILEQLEKGSIRFESVLGVDFIDEFRERVLLLEAQKQQRSTKSFFARNKKDKNTKNATKFTKGNAQNGQVTSNGVLEKEKAKTERLKKKEKKKQFHEYDKNMQIQIIMEIQKRERRRKGILAGCVFVVLACAGMYGYSVYSDINTKNDQEELLEVIESSPKEGSQKEVKINYEEEQTEELPVLPQYEELKKKNEDLIGWIKIADTKIDYPVMKTLDRSYYLIHSFDGKQDKNGCIFMDPECNVEKRSTNIILYGHHMRSGNMFGQLDQYASRSFYEKHRTFRFDTIYEEANYEVLFAFRSKVYYEEEVTFKYYQFIDAVSEDAFLSNIEEMRALALYETDARVQFGDKLLTLSTCDSSEEQGRFVVVAKKIE